MKIGPVILELVDESPLLQAIQDAISNVLKDGYEPIMLQRTAGMEGAGVVSGAECEIVLRAYLHGKGKTTTGRLLCIGTYPLRVEPMPEPEA